MKVLKEWCVLMAECFVAISLVMFGLGFYYGANQIAHRPALLLSLLWAGVETTGIPVALFTLWMTLAIKRHKVRLAVCCGAIAVMFVVMAFLAR